MTLAELLESRFRGDIRFRGDAYVKAERVAITRVTPESIYGAVRDGAEYQTQLTRQNGDIQIDCSCAANGGRKMACKHLWATVQAADTGGYVPGSLKPGHIPPFLVDEPDNGPLLFEDDEDDFLPGPGSRRRTRRPARTEEGEPATDRKPWEVRLAALREQFESQSSHDAGDRVDQEIVYEIDSQRSRDARQLVVTVSFRQRRANGQWGMLKSLKIRPDKLDEIDRDDDRRILAFLTGANPDTPQTGGRTTSPAHHRFQVPHELSLLVLPLMCESGRLSYRALDGVKSVPLQWDAGDPWLLTMSFQKADTVDGWTLTGRLLRGDESLAASDVALLLPGGLVGTQEHIALLQDFDAFGWIDILESGSGLIISDEESEEFVDRLLDMPMLPHLELPDHLKLEEVKVDPAPLLFVKTPKLRRQKRWQSDKLPAEVRFDYLGTLVPASSSQWGIVQREAGRCLVRNQAREEQLWSQLQDSGFRRLRDRRRGGYDVETSLRDLGSAVRRLIENGWQVLADDKPVRQPGTLHFKIRTDIDWFELSADVNFEGAGLAFPELLSALARGDNTVRLDDGSLGLLPEEWIQRYGLLAGLADVDGEHVRLARNQAALLDALLSTQESVDYDAQFAELRQKLGEFTGITEADEPEGFRGHLRKYQREGLGWLEFLADFRFGGCLADDMGLGKTVQVLALLARRKTARGDHLPSLVVVPKSLIFNWRQECRRFAPNLSILEYAGPDRAALRSDFANQDVILCTYGTMRRDALALREIPFDYIVLDEAQTIKNPGSQVAKASRLLQARHRVALSGTPVENHLGDLWSIFEFLNPGMLGRSSVFRSYTSESVDQASRNLLSKALRPFILRRTKDQVASELPKKFEKTILCRMGTDQRRLYDELREHYRTSLLGLVADQGLSKSKMHVLEALLRLRQAACHPGLLDENKRNDSSAKFDVLIPQIEELVEEGHKALVFSQFTSMLALLRQQLDKRNITYEYLDGQTRDREAPVKRFQNDPDCGLFLISLKAGGLGLNLTAAEYVFLLDPWWNPAVETQAIDRAHRVGQTKRVFAYRLICRNTVEEKIAKLQKQKKSLADAILAADNSNLLKDMTSDDLEMLLS